MAKGTCVYCGCTDEQACEAGCSWADEDHSVCTRCEFAAEVASLFVAVHTQLRKERPIEWSERPVSWRIPYVMASRAVLDGIRESFLESIGEETAAGAVELAKLAGFLHANHPEAMARADERATVVDVVLQLLGDKRIVLATR